MKQFELQWVIDQAQPTRSVGLVLFDKEDQQLRYYFLNNLVTGDAAPLVGYLQKEFKQMQAMMTSGLSFTPFHSVSQITSQLLPAVEAPIRFLPPQVFEGANIDQVLLDAKSLLSA